MGDPTQGARWREGLLLAAYLVLAVIGVWTVAIAELATQEPALGDSRSVAAPPQNSRPAGD